VVHRRWVPGVLGAFRGDSAGSAGLMCWSQFEMDLYAGSVRQRSAGEFDAVRELNAALRASVHRAHVLRKAWACPADTGRRCAKVSSWPCGDRAGSWSRPPARCAIFAALVLARPIGRMSRSTGWHSD